MYAVLHTGGKQYKVSKGDVIQVEKLDGEVGASVRLDKVLIVGEGDNVQVGAPFLDGYIVTGEVTEQSKGPKILVFKKRRRKNYRRKNGHRQLFTRVKITAISK
ncbi:MAG: 50S ribosomal protein L21 [Nitrospinae bacterium RIFCSPLOWO2_12_FULL_47_7]|nr:MAG: 50S ribosomal protein L21 [Nitrospinae bacterium RIFCSPLOWO2_12_FULL_47_7]